jgi:stage IV sporulation protein FB
MIALFGFGSSQIVLGGMGGVTINRRKAKAWQDMLISLSGPLASFGLMWLSIWLTYNIPVVRTDAMLIALVPRMYWANKFWGMFNLIPVPPLDGGHAVRDFFRTFLSERRAFIIAIWIAIIGGGAAVAYLFWAGELFIALFVAWFVFMAFQQWQYFREHGTPGD